MSKKYSKCNCPDEEIYVSEDDGFYDLYIKNPYVEENKYINSKSIITEINYSKDKEKLPKIRWEKHKDNVDAYNYGWKKAFEHIKRPTKENGFIRTYIDTAFNGNIFISDSCAMMSYAKYAFHIVDLAGTLENFYSKQHLDGFICRELRGDNGKDRFHRHDPITTGPFWFSYTEWELYRFNGNKSRLKKVFAPLMAYHSWIKENRTNPDGSYWYTGLASTMDNQPRVLNGYSTRLDNSHLSWVDANLLAILDCDALINISKIINRSSETKELVKEKKQLIKYVIEKQWDEETKFFYNTTFDGKFIKTKSCAAFWVLQIDEIPKKYKSALIKHLENKDEFNRFNPIPVISADSDNYDSNGLYWRGGVWSCIETMVLKGLAKCKRFDLAFDFALRHNDAVTKEFVRDNTLWEVYSPDSLDRSIPSVRDYIGWSGSSAISILLEYIFGIIPHPLENRIEWHINLLDAFEVKNYYFNGQYISLKCLKRKEAEDVPEVMIDGDDVIVDIYFNNDYYTFRLGE